MGDIATVRAARTTGREEPEAVVATVAARRAGHYFIHALYTNTLKHMHTGSYRRRHALPPPPPRPHHHHLQTRHARRLLLTGMRLCEVFPRELRSGQRLCRSHSVHRPRIDHTVPYGAPPPSRPTLYFTRAPHGRGRADSKSGAYRPAGRAERGAYSLACRAEGGKSRGAPPGVPF